MDLFGGLKKAFGGDDKISSAEQQPEDVKRLVAHIRGKIEDCRSQGQRVVWESTTMSNIAYLLGFDSVYWDSRTREFKTLYNLGRGLNKNRIRANKILPLAQNRAARLCKVPPRYDVKPENNTTEAKDAARLSLDVINMIWDVQKLNQKRIPLVMWTQQAGYAFIKTCWDDQAGRMVAPGEYEGDIRIEVVSPFEIYADPLATTLAECQWLVHAKVRKLDYFKSRYENGYLVKQEDAWLLSTQYELRVNSLNAGGPASSTTDMQMKNAAIELSYYEKPSKNHPNGRQIIIANGVLLEDKELPIGEIPFAKFDDVVIGGKFQSEAVITHARPLQDYLNQNLTKRAQWLRRLLAGKYAAPRGHGLSPESLNDQSGELLEYNVVPNAPMGGQPVQLKVPDIPQYAYEEEQRTLEHLNDAFGLNEISQGRVPEAGMPAAGMSILLEQDSTRIGIITENHEHAWADVGRHILKYISKYYITPRLLKTAGSGLDYAVKDFVGADLRDSHDVSVIRGSTIPNSKVLERQEIRENYMSGLMGDPADPALRQKVFAMMEFGDVEEMWQDFSIDMAQIKRDIDAIQKGEMPKVSELDNHPLFVQEMNRFRKSEKYQTLSPEVQAIFEGCMEEHLQWIVKLQNPGLTQHVDMANQMADKASQMTPQDAMEHAELATPVNPTQPSPMAV